MAQYRIPVLEKFSWQPPVKSIYANGPPAANVKGDRYIVGATPTALKAWVGKEEQIATCSANGDADTATWLFDIPDEGWQCWNEELDQYWYYDETATWNSLQAGYSGYSGYSGVGTSGYSGYSGISGYSGKSGYSGYSSTSGYSGKSGYSGYSGKSGYSGYSGVGTSGYSGYSGKSGYSGPGAVYDSDYECLLISA